MNPITPSLISPAIPEVFSETSFSEGSPLSIGVLASGSGSNFEAIAQAIQDGKLNARIQILIYNNPTARVVERAKRFDIPAILLDHRKFKARESLDREIVAVLQEHQVEWVVMAGWMRIVTQVLIDAFPGKMINIHPSLLPSFPGIRAIEQALKAGVKITGCTAHLVELAVDSGPILMQAAVPVLPDDTLETLHARIQVEEHRIIVGAIAQVARKPDCENS
ncbi:MAG: phosphoribosylglycinamide formyltransferase [Microcoleaceae cyanobacterium]